MTKAWTINNETTHGRIVDEHGFTVADHIASKKHAALIAASPKLLKAVEAITKGWLDTWLCDDGTVINVRALIAEARGEK